MEQKLGQNKLSERKIQRMSFPGSWKGKQMKDSVAFTHGIDLNMRRQQNDNLNI